MFATRGRAAIITISRAGTVFPGKDSDCRRRAPIEICNKGAESTGRIEELLVLPMMDHPEPVSTTPPPGLITSSVEENESQERASSLRFFPRV